MVKFTVYLKESKSGWEWSRFPDRGSWWGYYKTEGRARGAAKLSLRRAIGTSSSKFYEFIKIGNDADE